MEMLSEIEQALMISRDTGKKRSGENSYSHQGDIKSNLYKVDWESSGISVPTFANILVIP